jgi:sarcosine/dimethylglycine N-methyltransferase
MTGLLEGKVGAADDHEGERRRQPRRDHVGRDQLAQPDAGVEPIRRGPGEQEREPATTDALDGVRDHYRATGLTERLKTALAALGPDDQRLTPKQLAGVDQFHTRGLAATAELAELARIKADVSVLDVGSGVGGPARFLAAAYGCRVTGVDLSEPFVDAARYLTGRTGQSGLVSFEIASAFELPFDDGSFDVVLLLHVAMNIADRARLYREIRRVLKSSGRFATFDVVSMNGEPHYPLPWARTPAASFLMTAAGTREAIESAGFRALAWRDDTEAAKAWAAKVRASGPPPSLNLGVVMGPDFAELAANLGRNLLEGRFGVLTAVFETNSSRQESEGS